MSKIFKFYIPTSLLRDLCVCYFLLPMFVLSFVQISWIKYKCLVRWWDELVMRPHFNTHPDFNEYGIQSISRHQQNVRQSSNATKFTSFSSYNKVLFSTHYLKNSWELAYYHFIHYRKREVGWTAHSVLQEL